MSKVNEMILRKPIRAIGKQKKYFSNAQNLIFTNQKKNFPTAKNLIFTNPKKFFLHILSI